MAEPVYGFNRKDAESVVELLGGDLRALNRRPFMDHNALLFLARSRSGGIPAATGTWPSITLGSAVCDLAQINDSNVLGPALGLDAVHWKGPWLTLPTLRSVPIRFSSSRESTWATKRS